MSLRIQNQSYVHDSYRKNRGNINASKTFNNLTTSASESSNDLEIPSDEVQMSEIETKKFIVNGDLSALKQNFKLFLLENLYHETGIADEVPKSIEELSETDKALLKLADLNRKEGVGWLVGGVGNITQLPGIGRVGLRIMDENAADMAYKLAWHEAYYDDEAIMKRIESLGLSEDADIDYIFSFEKALGKERVNKLNECIDKSIAMSSWDEALNTFEVLEHGFQLNDETRGEVEALSNSFSELYRSTITRCRNVIEGQYGGNLGELRQDFYSGKLADSVRDESYADTAWKVTIRGEDYTRKDLRQLFDAYNKSMQIDTSEAAMSAYRKAFVYV